MSLRMLHLHTAFIALFAVLLSLCSCQTEKSPVSSQVPRERINIDFDWRFALGDHPEASVSGFNDGSWRTVDLPHDWSIEGDYRRDNPAGIAGGFLPTGIGWYRKRIAWKPEWKDKRVTIEFDGVYMNSEVWINGHYLGKRPYGYVSFAYDLTDHLAAGHNVIAVRVDNSKSPSGRWYTGSGIYRHVWLNVTSQVHVPVDGTFVHSENITKSQADLRVTTEVVNKLSQSRRVTIKSEVLDAKDRVVASDESSVDIAANELAEVERVIRVANLKLWSIESPHLYRVKSTIMDHNEILDQYVTTTGIRKIRYTVDRGFLLNDQPMIMQGVSMHHDAGPVGSAVPEDVLRRRLKLLKEMGVNALRPAHTPFASEFYQMADEMGFLVMNEAFDGWWQPKAKYDYGHYFDEWWQRDLTSVIRRSRNHPSVVMWSIGNEVKGFKPEQQKIISDFVKTLDTTRPITQGRGYAGGYLDIDGFNGHGEYKGALEKHHKKRPKVPIVGTEITHTMHTRGVFRSRTVYRTRDNPAPWELKEEGPARAKRLWGKMKHKVFHVEDLTEEEVFTGIDKTYGSSFDNSLVRMPIRDQIRKTRELPYFIGSFRWTAFDYLGESFGWPARTANFGVLDLAGFPKGPYFLYQSQWSDEPMVHMSPYWTHLGKEGVEIPVVVYTNQESAELVLNGKSLGEKEMTDEMQLVWKVPYEPGELKVLAKTNDKVVCQQVYRTAGEPALVKINVDKVEVSANRRDVVHLEIDIVDKDGNYVPHANNRLNFTLEGPARLIGVENGDILDLEPHKVPTRKAFMGKALAMIQATDKAGKITVTVSGEGLQSQSIVIRSNR